tara:strand:+ start:68 stop:685 length:618 start_codon:yes stop_codon:yes gene_type:complete
MQNIQIEEIIPYSRNPRKNQHVDKVATSIKEFGFQQPIVVDKNMVVIVGHTRLLASQKLGLKEVPVLVADLSESKAKAYRIADNRLNEDSNWDDELLNLELIDLQKDDYDLDSLGFEKNELEKIFNSDDPLFVAPDQSFEEVAPNVEDLMPSQVRMIQLFLDSETEPKFKEMVSALQKKLDINNLTDTVYKVVENEYNRSKADFN